MITVQNVEKVTKQLINYGVRVRQEVSKQIILVGNRIIQELQINYPDLTITGQFFPENMEYWIVISRLGEELTWIKCPVSNLYFTKGRDEKGFQEFRSTVPELDLDGLVKRIADELSLQINAMLGRKV